jgi:spermidine synthase
MSDWYFENQLEGFGLNMKVKQRLYKGKSPFQDIEVMETFDYGNLLTLDGLVMVTERDEFYYHEILTHPAMFTHKNPEKVLIIGGGDCGTLREVLKHKSVKEAHMCEIDGEVVEVSKKYFKFTKPAIDDKRSTLFIEDGFKFLENNKNTYDVIIVDSTDPIGEAAKLFGEDFYNLCYNSLKEDGIVVGQAGCYMYSTDEPKGVHDILKNKFKISRIYTGLTPTYPSGFWSFYFASKSYCMKKDFDAEKVIQSAIQLKYYNEEIHVASTALPSFLRKSLDGN